MTYNIWSLPCRSGPLQTPRTLTHWLACPGEGCPDGLRYPHSLLDLVTQKLTEFRRGETAQGRHSQSQVALATRRGSEGHSEPLTEEAKHKQNPAFALCLALQPCIGKVINLLLLGFSLLSTKGVFLSQVMSRKTFNRQAKKACVHPGIGGWSR